jgi:hypothetical protein
MLRYRRGLVACLGPLLAFAWANPAFAHGFGQRYDLPIPLAFYVWGAGATVALSFFGFALFLRQEPKRSPFAVDWHPPSRFVDAIILGARALAAGGLILVIVAGFFGSQDPIHNIAPVAVWVIGWVGIGFLSLLLGDVWRLVNPWDEIFAAAESAYRRMHAGAALSLGRCYPQWLTVWPAFVLFILFAWMELVWSGRNVPAELAAALLVYSAFTWFGMFVFGREVWLERGEVFTLVFGTFARFAPFARAPDGEGGIRVRPPAVGLLEDEPLTISMVALVVALLATVSFDGFLETPLWAAVDFAVLDWASLSPSWTAMGLREDQAVRVVRTFALLGCVLLFLAVYAGVCWLSAAVSGEREPGSGIIVRRFVLALVPIALAYHVAHYFSFLFIGGQYAIPRLSDPFGYGWNLFGTAGYQVDIGVVTPRLQWTVAVVSVVLGHLIAVYLSHVTALRVFRSSRAALRSQIPMVLLMVGYTMISLWILSQPIVETGAG